MKEGHLERILRDAAGSDVLDVLTERLAPTDLQSLFLEVYRKRASRIAPSQILDQYRQSRFVRPATVDPIRLRELEQLAFKLAKPDFEPIELAPVCPLGVVSVLGDVSQDWAIPTARNSEVVSDPTNVLALECAIRRKAGVETVRLCASHRVVRAQQFDAPLSFAHFQVLGLCTAARDTGSSLFEKSALIEHLTFYARFLSNCCEISGRPVHIGIALTAWAPEREDWLTTTVVPPLQSEFPNVDFAISPERERGRNYYDHFCFEVSITDKEGQVQSVCDGGFTDWTAKLLANKKEKLLISGIGLERLCLLMA